MQSPLPQALRYATLASALALACCAPPPPPPAPTPPPIQRPAPAPAPPPVVQQPEYENWLDAPQTSGDWSYTANASSSAAIFRSGSDAAVFGIGCVRSSRTVSLMRRSELQRPLAMRILTETSQRMLNAAPNPDSRASVVVSLQPRDPLLDAMALSRGRFAVETEGQRTLYLPAWAEVTRVIEDCR